MIRRLRRRFIALTMAALLLVLALIMGGVNLVNYKSILGDADSVLSVLAENGGMFPKGESASGGKNDEKKLRSPEVQYESRYFSVLLDEKGSVVTVDTGKIAAVDTSTAIEYAQKAWAGGAGTGFVSAYRYVRKEDGDNIRMIFLDCGRGLSTFRNFLLTSLGISLAGFLAVFILILFFSGRIIRPVSESYEKQKRFITDAGHEIKTPLTIINADADILEMDVGENEWLQDIQKQTSRLTALTNDLIYLSRMEEETAALQAVEFPLSDLVTETADSFQSLAKTQGKRFTCTVEPMLSCCGDERALRQLVSILLDNALKYSPEGGEIRLTLERQGRTVRLSVQNDTREPVEKESLDRLFDRFYRADPSRNSRTGGYGIGLSIAKAIVSAHKGKITAASPDGTTLLMTAVLPG